MVPRQRLFPASTSYKRIPIAITPVKGEALDSWFLSSALRLEVPAGLLAEALGLERKAVGGTYRQLFELDADLRRASSRAGLSDDLKIPAKYTAHDAARGKIGVCKLPQPPHGGARRALR